MRKELYDTASSHLREKDLPALIKDLGLESIVDSSKMTLEDATELYHLQDSYGGLTLPHLKKHYKTQGQPLPGFLKSEDKKKK